MAEGDTNFTNVSASGDLTAGDDLTVTDDATITDDASIGGDLTVTGSATVSTNLSVTGNTTATAALYTANSDATITFACGPQWDGGNPFRVAYLRMYDHGTGAWRNCWLNSGTFTAI
jgi:hypothetical protein